MYGARGAYMLTIFTTHSERANQQAWADLEAIRDVYAERASRFSPPPTLLLFLPLPLLPLSPLDPPLPTTLGLSSKGMTSATSSLASSKSSRTERSSPSSGSLSVGASPKFIPRPT